MAKAPPSPRARLSSLSSQLSALNSLSAVARLWREKEDLLSTFLVISSLFLLSPLTIPAAESTAPTHGPVQMLIPGFTVRELPLRLSNQNNVQYAPDGRLFAAGYDGRLHLLRDTDGDGLEDAIVTFQDKTSPDYPLGMVVRGDSVYILFRSEVARFRDTNGDGIPDQRETAISNWDDPSLTKNPLYEHRRVDDALGLALAHDGSFYISMGNGAYNNGYVLDKAGQNHYSPANRRGCVLHISADGKKVEQIASGVRYLMSLQFNRAGDLFATDQEGATWLPNGNPFDELLHIQSGRHYGFPPAHPRYLTNVVDEPSVFDYAPQHQSLCGFRFNESGPGQGRFGPASWEGDAILTGESRGKLYRTKLVKTEAGYVAQNQLIASLGLLTIDCTLSPAGDLLVACHGGQPDWGSGPNGAGRLFKIRYAQKSLPQPALAWSASPNEIAVAFDQPLDAAQLRNLTRQTTLTASPYAAAGDQFETIRPGYAVVKMQQATPVQSVPVLSANVTADHRTLLLRTPPQSAAVNYPITLPGLGRPASFTQSELPQHPSIDTMTTLQGLAVSWKGQSGNETWQGWLPHADLAVARAFTQSSAGHDTLWNLLKKPGTLTLRGQLDLRKMLQPALQPGAKLDYDSPSETVTVTFSAKAPFSATTGQKRYPSQLDGTVHRLSFIPPNPGSDWCPITLELSTGPSPTSLQTAWFTATDSRPRAFPLRRFFLPWAAPESSSPSPATSLPRPELAGGNWEKGRALFFGDTVSCSKCHQAGGSGGKLGPDLSNLIHRDYDSVLKDIREPSAAINPDHLASLVELIDGDILTGVILSETPQTITLADASAQPREIARAKIKSLKPSSLSLMPEGLDKALPPEPFRDLMTFLLTEPRASATQ